MLRRLYFFSYPKFPIRSSQPSRLLRGNITQIDLDKESGLNLANQCAEAGEIQKTEAIYKKLIEDYPTDKELYQKLWNSWQTYRSLKVTEKEMNHFMAMYEAHIEFSNGL
jgi:hypothetical protein